MESYDGIFESYTISREKDGRVIFNGLPFGSPEIRMFVLKGSLVFWKLIGEDIFVTGIPLSNNNLTPVVTDYRIGVSLFSRRKSIIVESYHSKFGNRTDVSIKKDPSGEIFQKPFWIFNSDQYDANVSGEDMYNLRKAMKIFNGGIK